MSDVKCVEVMILGSKKDGGRKSGRPGNGVALHLRFYEENVGLKRLKIRLQYGIRLGKGGPA